MEVYDSVKKIAVVPNMSYKLIQNEICEVASQHNLVQTGKSSYLENKQCDSGF